MLFCVPFCIHGQDPSLLRKDESELVEFIEAMCTQRGTPMTKLLEHSSSDGLDGDILVQDGILELDSLT